MNHKITFKCSQQIFFVEFQTFLPNLTLINKYIYISSISIHIFLYEVHGHIIHHIVFIFSYTKEMLGAYHADIINKLITYIFNYQLLTLVVICLCYNRTYNSFRPTRQSDLRDTS